MRRRLLIALGSTVLALAVPSAALAHHGRGHHRHKGKAHHATVHFIHIGARGATTTVSPTGTSPTAPTSPTTPITPENAGTVTSFTGGVLTLTLNDGSTVSGKVTNETEIQCVKAAPTTPTVGTATEPTDESPGDDNGQGDDQSRGDTNQQGDQSSGDVQQEDQADGGDDDVTEGAPQSAPEPPCDSSALMAGTLVRSAELRVGPGGSEFESIVLVR